MTYAPCHRCPDMSTEHREILSGVAESATAAHREVLRARALLLAADGLATTGVARAVGVSAATVASWRSVYVWDGLFRSAPVGP